MVYVAWSTHKVLYDFFLIQTVIAFPKGNNIVTNKYCKSFSKKKRGKLFPKNLSGNFSDISGYFRKSSDGKISGEIFPENVGNFFVRRPVRKPPEKSPGLFRKTGGLFVRSRFGNGCFLHKFRGKIREVSLRIRTVSRKVQGGISPGIPGNSGGKIRGFFPVFSVFYGCNAGLTP